MRDIVLLVCFLFYLPTSLMAPAAGLICWEWFSIMAPHRQIYSFGRSLPFNLFIALATLLAWLFSKERKRFTPDALPWVMLVWFLWMSVTTIVAPIPDVAWPYWDRVMRTIVPVFLCFMLLTNRVRIVGMIWALVIALGYYGVKGGGYIVTGGGGVVLGPPGSMIFDNNQLALAVVMQIPLVYYLWRHTRPVWLRLGLAVTIPLEILMVFGSHSRGAVIALGVMLGAFWLRTDRKIVYGVIGVAIVAGTLAMMPPEFWQRLDTLNDVEADNSFQGRLAAWQVALACARDYFPFGAGFYTPQLDLIFNRYLPGEVSHAAHSIYFQVLGEHGYVGLALYLPVLLLPLYNATLVVRRTRKNPELAWAHDLADIIRIALLGFYVGGAALSVAYFDGYLVLVALTSTLRELTAPKRAAATVPRFAALSAASAPVARAEAHWPRRALDGLPRYSARHPPA